MSKIGFNEHKQKKLRGDPECRLRIESSQPEQYSTELTYVWTNKNGPERKLQKFYGTQV